MEIGEEGFRFGAMSLSVFAFWFGFEETLSAFYSQKLGGLCAPRTCSNCRVFLSIRKFLLSSLNNFLFIKKIKNKIINIKWVQNFVRYK